MPTIDASTTAPAVRLPAIREAGFSIIEAIIAMFILTVVIGGAAFAVTSSVSVSSKASFRTEQAAMARKVLERVEGDLAMRDRCMGTVWRSASGTSSTPCTEAQANGGTIMIKDDRGRRWTATAAITPVDDAADGSGTGDATTANAAASPGGDADQRVHDRYEARISVSLDKRDQPTGATPAAPFTLTSFLGWETSLDPSLRVDVCQHYRRDRTIDASSCGPGGLLPLAGIVVTLTPTPEPGNPSEGAAPIRGRSGGDGIARFSTAIPHGTWRITVADRPGATLYRITPAVVTLNPGEQQQASAVMVAAPGATQMCIRITNPDNYGFGYRTNRANYLLNEQFSPVYTGNKVEGLAMTTTCAPMSDPVGYEVDKLFAAAYGIEIPDIPGELEVRAVTVDCAGEATGAALEDVQPEPAARLGGRKQVYRQVPNVTSSICFDVWANPVIALDCAPGSGAGCILVGTECVVYCPAGQIVCTANCDNPEAPLPPEDPAAPPASATTTFINSRTGSAYGGPNDGDLGGRCLMNPAGSGVFYGTGSNANVPNARWSGAQWTGGTGSSSGRFADGSVYNCNDIVFAVKSDIPRGTCLELRWGGRSIRGRARDRIGAAGRIDMTIGAAMMLMGDTSYNAFQWGIKTVDIFRVDGDPVCNSGGGAPVALPPPVMEFAPPKIVEIWKQPDPTCLPGCMNAADTATLRGNAGGGQRAA